MLLIVVVRGRPHNARDSVLRLWMLLPCKTNYEDHSIFRYVIMVFLLCFCVRAYSTRYIVRWQRNHNNVSEHCTNNFGIRESSILSNVEFFVRGGGELSVLLFVSWEQLARLRESKVISVFFSSL